MTERFLVMLITTAVAASMYSCASESTSQDEGDAAAQGEVAEVETEKKVVYYATPSLVEIATIMKSSGATFSGDLLNSPDNLSAYSTHFQKSVNLGVDGADLSYSAMFDETQDAIHYLRVIKTIAEDIGLTGAFESGFLESIEKNINDRDALLDIITDFYWSTDAYLADNERLEVSSLIVTGGWIESMHIACDMANRSPKNQDIKRRIAEQKLILKNLLLFLNASASEDSNVFECIAEMKELSEIFEEIEVKQESGKSVTDAAKGETVIGNETVVNISQEQLAKLCTKIQSIRSRFTKV